MSDLQRRVGDETVTAHKAHVEAWWRQWREDVARRLAINLARNSRNLEAKCDE